MTYSKFLRTGLKLGTGGAVAAAGVYGYNDPLIRRNIYMWSVMTAPLIHYRGMQLWIKHQGYSDEVANQMYQPLHDRYCPRIKEMNGNLKGFYIKCAQFCTTQSDTIPPEYLDMCESFYDQCPMRPSAPEDILKAVTRELGRPIDEVFLEFDPVPLASASIGQVHRGKLLDGTPVAVKLQHPEAETTFRNDLIQIIYFCNLAQPEWVVFLSETEKQFMNEFDYRVEATNLESIRKNIMPKFGDKVQIPRAFTELCTKDMLVMELLNGEKMADVLMNQAKEEAKRRGITTKEIMDEMKQQPPLPTWKVRYYNVLRDSIWLLQNTWNVTKYIGTFGLAPEFNDPSSSSSGVFVPRPQRILDVKTLMDLLLEVHGYQFLINGAFNGDAHPGNILIGDDGRIGLCDYGQVKFLSNESRRKLARIILATLSDDINYTRDEIKETGMMITEKMDTEPHHFATRAQILFNKENPEILEGNCVQFFLEILEKRDKTIFLDDDCVMPARLSCMMRGMGKLLNLDIQTGERWAHLARQALKEEKDPKNDRIPVRSASIHRLKRSVTTVRIN